ncbi:DedA family protein [Aliikangiella coralliicola]|uniref:DedA family protein n=1 Tax=Aliikangiella coralliicola TaxID=2592383 RepID=A0A545UEG6_9GAMM|nr:DedA family protein [Aliikangiella coralliicola]TQV87871.1 DedA family protein [Aliikangiella coralliicola]
MIENILSFVEQNAHWAGVIIFSVAFLESMAIVGLLIPGWILLVGIGTMIGADALSFYPVVFAAYLGAVIGEYISFYAGYHYHEKILSWSFVAKHQKIIEKSRVFFEKHGVGGVFIGRFFGPTRAVVPLIAGISEMNKVTFFWVNLISGIIWAPLYLIPGILVGAAFSLDKSQGYELIFILVIIVGTLGFAIKASKSYWRERYNNDDTLASVLKPALWWCIALVSLLIFVRSPYWNLFTDILSIVLDKL